MYQSQTVSLDNTSWHMLMFVGWDVEWCPRSRITTSLTYKRPFFWISMKSRLVRAATETSTFHKWSPFIKSRRRYMAEILAIRRKTLYNQSINVLITEQGVKIVYTRVPIINVVSVQTRTLAHHGHVTVNNQSGKALYRIKILMYDKVFIWPKELW